MIPTRSTFFRSFADAWHLVITVAIGLGFVLMCFVIDKEIRGEQTGNKDRCCSSGHLKMYSFILLVYLFPFFNRMQVLSHNTKMIHLFFLVTQSCDLQMLLIHSTVDRELQYKFCEMISLSIARSFVLCYSIKMQLFIHNARNLFL